MTNISDIHLKSVILTQRQTTSNGRRFDVSITLIRRRPNFDEFPRHFHVLFRCNFADRKIHVVSTYFFWRYFNGRKIDFVSTYFFRRNFDGGKIHVVCTYFFWRNFYGQKFSVVFGRLQANENIWGGFPTLVTLKVH